MKIFVLHHYKLPALVTLMSYTPLLILTQSVLDQMIGCFSQCSAQKQSELLPIEKVQALA